LLGSSDRRKEKKDGGKGREGKLRRRKERERERQRTLNHGFERRVGREQLEAGGDLLGGPAVLGHQTLEVLVAPGVEVVVAAEHQEILHLGNLI
jgi:hypothetical protein